MRDVVATLRVGHEALRALGGPLDRLPDLAGRPGDDRLLGIMEDLRAKPAADIRRDDPQLGLRYVQYVGAHQQPDHMRVLAGRVERMLAGRAVVFADRGARLHRIGDEAVVDQVELDDLGGLADCGLHRGGIAQMPIVADIARRLRPDLRRTRLQCRDNIDDRRLDGVIDRDFLGAVARLSQGLGDNDRDGIADMTNAIDREHRMQRLLHWRAVFRGNQPAAGQAANLILGHVLAGEDGDDAGRRGRAARVDAAEARVGVRAAQDVGVELARPVDVVGIGALSGQEAVIIAAPGRWAVRSLGHRRYSAATPWGLAGGASPRITAAPSAIASTMLW